MAASHGVGRAISSTVSLTSSGSAEPGAASVIDHSAVWAGCSGSIDGEQGGTAGLAILDHPRNPGHPSAWFGFDSTHAGEYCYFCAAVLRSAGDVVLDAGESWTLRYRVVVHDGPTGSVPLDQLQAAFAAGTTGSRAAAASGAGGGAHRRR